jgi:DNA-binding response OmpR family regulator
MSVRAGLKVIGESMKKILIVDDNKDIRELEADILTEKGFITTTAASGKECLNLLSQEKYDLVLLDLMMPGKDGWVVCHEIRKNSLIPIIIVSGDDRERSSRMADKMYQAVDFITKPFTTKEFLSAVHKALGMK